MAELYDDIPSIAVIYEGTVAQFEETLKNTLKAKEFYGRLVFITGNQSSTEVTDKKQAIWVSEEDGNNAHFLNMSDVSTLAAQLQYVKGIQVGDTRYPTVPGGTFLTLVGADITIGVDTETGTITFDASAIKNLASSANSTAATANASANAALGSIVKMWGSDTDSSIRDIAADEAGKAKAYADEIVEDLVEGDTFVKPADIIDDNTNKFKPTLLPDVILGQLKFGGLIGAAGVSVDTVPIYVKPSANYVAHFERQNGDAFSVNETDFLATNNEGWYFIVGTVKAGVAPTFMWGDVSYSVGDWFLSTGSEWVKIDNTDAVTAVAGEKGDVKISAITGRDSDTAKGVVAASLDKADSAIQHLRAGEQNGLNWEDDEYITVGKLVSSSAFNIEQQRTATIKTKTETIGNAISDTSKKGLATAEDIAAYLKARLSIKVVTAN